jgi:D-sedoheptulose 7-phosphate isomerase
MKTTIQNEIIAHVKTADLLHNLTDKIAESANLCINCLHKNGKILIFGNGGSAADAQHIAAELVGRFKLTRKGLPALALTTDTSVLTSIGNDFGYENVFSRQVEALANPGDIIIAISTSGSSANVIRAIKKANKLKCPTIGLSGGEGGLMDKICDINLISPSDDTPRIQEAHIIIGHIICHLIDQEFHN